MVEKLNCEKCPIPAVNEEVIEPLLKAKGTLKNGQMPAEADFLGMTLGQALASVDSQLKEARKIYGPSMSGCTKCPYRWW
jgi:hypothetical protein